MTEYTDSKGGQRIRWGPVEWIGSVTVTIVSLAAIGIGAYAWSSIEQNDDSIRALRESRAAQSERIRSITEDLNLLKEVPPNLSKIIVKLEGIENRTYRIENRLYGNPD